jgi:hypothetical protein
MDHKNVKEATMFCFRLISQPLSWKTEKNHEKIQNNRSPDLFYKLMPEEQGTGFPTTQVPISVGFSQFP